MDNKKVCKIPYCGVDPGAPGEHLVVGVKQLRKALARKNVARIYLARDADPALTQPLALESQSLGIPLVWFPTMAELGRACGIEVGAAAAATLSDVGSYG